MKKLTIKEKRPIDKDQLKQLLKLYEIAYGVNLKKEYVKNKTVRKYELLDDGTKCLLCGEQEVLERAHIIPHEIVGGMHASDDIGNYNYRNHAISLCPNHHRRYDKYKLEPDDRSIIRRAINESGYQNKLAGLLMSVEVLTPNKEVDKRLDAAWGWWKEYVYGY